MRKNTQLPLLLSAAVTFACTTASAGNDNGNGNQKPLQQQQQQGQQGRRHVDLVIALDTSSSMDGLIDGARNKLWDVVNLLATAKPTPILRVGLISYGNDGYNSNGGWVRKEADLTTDLDSINGKLFGLTTNGGSEYVARAVHDATRDMKWDMDEKTLRIIFVAGNESAAQDPMIPVDRAIGEARQKGIFVNSIYCGSEGSSDAVGWRNVAALGKGQYAAIDHNQVIAIAAPQDVELAKLSAQLNGTYVAYGPAGGTRALEQAAQDKNAASASAPTASARAAAKASALYRNEEWDLVDAQAGGKDIGRIAPAQLPEPLRNLSADERKAYVEKKAKERETIRKQIATLNAEREAYVKKERAKRADASAKGLDDALNSAVRTEAESAGFGF